MNKEELHNFIEKQQPNICQIVAIKDDEIVYSDTWNDYKSDDVIMAEIDRITKKMEGRGRVLIRPSGTEPLVRVMIEGKDVDVITEKARMLADLLEKKLG